MNMLTYCETYNNHTSKKEEDMCVAYLMYDISNLVFA